MAQWMQCSFIQHTPLWADSVCNISTKVGGDDVPRIEIWEARKAKKRDDALDRIVRQAFDRIRGIEPESPVEVVEAKVAQVVIARRPQIDLASLDRSVARVEEILGRMDEIRRANEEDDDFIMLLH